MRWSTAARVASRAGSLLCHHAPSPCPTSCTPRKVRRAVWRTHTQWVAPLVAWGTRRLRRAATARVRHAFSPRHTPSPAHTRPSQLYMAHPAPHMTATETRATPRQPRRPHRARPAHPAGGVPSSLHPLAPAACARIKRAVQGRLAPQQRSRSCALRAPTSSGSSAPQKTAHAGPPDPCAPRTAFFCRAGLGPREPQRPPPQRTAPCTAHRWHKTSRDTPHLRRRGTRHPVLLPRLTPKLHTGRFLGCASVGI